MPDYTLLWVRQDFDTNPKATIDSIESRNARIYFIFHLKDTLFKKRLEFYVCVVL